MWRRGSPVSGRLEVNRLNSGGRLLRGRPSEFNPTGASKEGLDLSGPSLFATVFGDQTWPQKHQIQSQHPTDEAGGLSYLTHVRRTLSLEVPPTLVGGILIPNLLFVTVVDQLPSALCYM